MTSLSELPASSRETMQRYLECGSAPAFMASTTLVRRASRRIFPKTNPRRPSSRSKTIACGDRVSETLTEMSNDSGAVVNAAVDAAMSLHSRTMRPSELSSEKLAALCRIKGLRQRPSTSASEQRRVLVDAVTKYLDDEYSARTKLGKWDSLSEAARIRLLHRVCNAEGDVTYYDPATGYTVFSAFAHLRRGHCCGIEDGTGARMHRCRHCPYADDGTLPSKQMVAMKERISLVDAFREELTARTHTDHAVSTPSSKPAQSDSAVAHDPVAASVGSVETDVDVCPTCHGTEMMVCTRCNGWTILASPIIRKCQQCNASGWHGCMDCTPWRPRQRTEFYS